MSDDSDLTDAHSRVYKIRKNVYYVNFDEYEDDEDEFDVEFYDDDEDLEILDEIEGLYQSSSRTQKIVYLATAINIGLCLVILFSLLMFLMTYGG